ncbi:MAG: CYTH domain-containing protein [Mycoplasmatales bacterium]
MEFEKKGIISEDDFFKIIKKTKVKEIITQDNYYFETSDEFFKNNNSALRVRVKNDAYELTLKVQRELGNLEYNYDISKEEFTKMKITMKLPKVLHKYIDSTLTFDNIKIIKTDRHIIEFNQHIIELDKTTFMNSIDYEIEVEAENLNQAQKIMDQFTGYVDIKYNESMPKIARYDLYNK